MVKKLNTLDYKVMSNMRLVEGREGGRRRMEGLEGKKGRAGIKAFLLTFFSSFLLSPPSLLFFLISFLLLPPSSPLPPLPSPSSSHRTSPVTSSWSPSSLVSLTSKLLAVSTQLS